MNLSALTGIGWLAAFFMLFRISVAAAQPSLNEISDFAGKICVSPPSTSASGHAELSGEGKAQLDGFLKKFAGIDVAAAAKLEGEATSGVLQKDLAEAIKNANDCRQAVAKMIIDKAGLSSRQSNAECNNQGQITGVMNCGNTYNNVTINREDNSVKRRLRDLFDSVDKNIMYQVAQGKNRLNIRMQPFELDRLQALIAEDKSIGVAKVVSYGPVLHGNTINNGSLGTMHSGDQQYVVVEVSPDLLR